MLNILSSTPSINEFIQGNCDFFPTSIEISIRRKSEFRSFRNNISYPRFRNNFQITSNYMASSRIAIHWVFTISGIRSASINIKIWNKFIKIKNDWSYRFVIFIAYYRCFRILKISRNGWDHRTVPEDTRQIYKIHSSFNERYLDVMTFVINFRIDVRTKSMLSITSS